jgi:hypothetical protein
MDLQRISNLHPLLRPDPRPCSSIYSQDVSIIGDNFSLEDLAHHVDESTKLAESYTLAQLITENEQLHRDTLYYRREWDALMRLLDELMDSALLIRTTLKDSYSKIVQAEAAWLAFWGIVEQSSYTHHWI